MKSNVALCFYLIRILTISVIISFEAFFLSKATSLLLREEPETVDAILKFSKE